MLKDEIKKINHLNKYNTVVFAMHSFLIILYLMVPFSLNAPNNPVNQVLS